MQPPRRGGFEPEDGMNDYSDCFLADLYMGAAICLAVFGEPLVELIARALS